MTTPARDNGGRFATSAPLPPLREDPAFVGATQVHAAFAKQVDEIRAGQRNAERTLTDQHLGQQIAAAKRAADAAIDVHKIDLNHRRAARINDLEASLPIGPAMPGEDTSPADRAVLHAAFRGALNDARSTPAAQLPDRLGDALRFGDEQLARGVATALFDQGKGQTVAATYRAAGQPDVGDALDELASFRNPDLTTDSLFESRAFSPVTVSPGPGAAHVAAALNPPRDPRIVGTTPMSRPVSPSTR